LDKNEVVKFRVDIAVVLCHASVSVAAGSIELRIRTSPISYYSLHLEIHQ